ncbi:prenyltransferase [Natronomonas gomsonensis]|uniref:prenyltransferase n=1 Tax=Natronomonas gomsonensis TaxID=1046043 RepID=UPI0015BDFA36|nr:prenyltransferase [Natronomonas gomsonensis]
MTDHAIDRLLPSEATPSGYVLRMSRPRFWFYLAGPVIVGVAYAAEAPSELFGPLAVALFAYFLLPANVFLYGVNDVFDADIDEANPKKDDREVRYQGDRLVPALVVLTGLAGLLFLPTLPTAGVVAMVGFLLLAVEYSAPPLRFKTTPFLDSLSNGLYVLPGVVAYAAVAGTAPPLAAVAGGWLWAMGMHTFSAIPDIEPDREAGIETTATFLGESRTYAYCAACWLAAAAVFGTVHPFFAAVLGVYPVFVAGIVAADVAVDRAYWWFPSLNTAAGMVLTLAALWVMLYA